MWYPGHISKAKRIIKENLKLVNAIIEIVDSRAPYSSRSYEFEDLFKTKKRIIIFNKFDICDEARTRKWIQLYKEKGYDVITTSLKNVNAKNFLMKQVAPLIPEKFGEKMTMVVGSPNVGKSTFINSLKGKKAAQVGNTPGITRGQQWIKVNEDFKVMDTPGILYPELFNMSIAYKLILIGSLKPEGTEIEDAAHFGYEVFKTCYPQYITMDNEIKESYYEYVEEFAKKRNFIKRGGVGDYERGLLTWMKEISDGKFGKATYEIPEDFEVIKI